MERSWTWLLVLCGLALAACGGKDKAAEADAEAGAHDVAVNSEAGRGDQPSADGCVTWCEESGSECGDDNCGGSCGECPESYECVETDIGYRFCFSFELQCPSECEQQNKECGWLTIAIAEPMIECDCGMCTEEQVCVGDESETASYCCTPDCDGKGCGDDGCGGICGTCDDGNPCTDDACDETGACVIVANQSECDDGDPCTTEDTCHEGSCTGVWPWKPVVMLLVDTSGSMEYSIDGEVEGELPECDEVPAMGTDYSRSRWVAVLEALTGTFNEYWCSYDYRSDDPGREDYMYSIWHVVPHGALVEGQEQSADGVLDQHGGEFKFGLMAFDTKADVGLGASGGFSYGPDMSAGGVSVNLGARNGDAPWGALVPPPAPDDSLALVATNDQVQAQLLSSTPYGGTPTSPALSDELHFVQTSPSVMPYDPWTETGDAGFACRGRSVILISGGGPDQGEKALGYTSSEVAAASLLAIGWSVFVVGFDLQGEEEEELLDKVALTGGTGPVRTASDSAELKEALEEILQEIVGGLGR